MRCKNCGFDNEEGRYICANCGSPLYDEDEEITDVQESGNSYASNQDNGAEDDDKNKKSIIIIIVLAVILVALIAGIVVSAVTGKDEETTTESTTISTTAEETTKKQTTKKKTTTEKETTTESTTATTQAPSTTAAVLYNVYIDIDGNGAVTGDGSYEKGKKAVLTATPDDGWQFDGWYENSTGELVASGNKFTVNVNKDITYTARFTKTEDAQ